MKMYIISYFVIDDTQFNLAFGCKVQKMQVETDKEKAEEAFSYYRSKSKFFAVDLHEVEVLIDKNKEMLLDFADHLNTYKGLEELSFDFMVLDYIEKKWKELGANLGLNLKYSPTTCKSYVNSKKKYIDFRLKQKPKEIIEIDGIKYKKI